MLREEIDQGLSLDVLELPLGQRGIGVHCIVVFDHEDRLEALIKPALGNSYQIARGDHRLVLPHELGP